VSETSSVTSTCIGCGAELPGERAELGYRYCTKESCQALYHRGLTVTAVGLNKSGETFVIADPDEIRRRGEAGEFTKKDTGVGLDYRPSSAAPAPAAPNARVLQQRRAQPSRQRRPWTPEQEKVVRLYHDMGLSPRQIVARARENTPRLGLTEALVVRIMSSLPRR
jgi:hypothetical protein